MLQLVMMIRLQLEKPQESAQTYIFLDSPGSDLTTYYTVCSSDISAIVSGTPTVRRIDVVLSEVAAASDVAEIYPTFSTSLDSGDIVTQDPLLLNGIKLSTSANDSKTVGVVSTKPAQIVGGATTGQNGVPVALAGRVPVKVTTLNGNIASGSAITTSHLSGTGMKQTQSGTIIGRALEATDNWSENTLYIA